MWTGFPPTPSPMRVIMKGEHRSPQWTTASAAARCGMAAASFQMLSWLSLSTAIFIVPTCAPRCGRSAFGLGLRRGLLPAVEVIELAQPAGDLGSELLSAHTPSPVALLVAGEVHPRHGPQAERILQRSDGPLRHRSPRGADQVPGEV